MTIKGISLIMAAIILSVYQLSRLDPSGALFSFISNSLPVNIGLIGLTALMVRLSFMRKKFTRRTSYAAVAGGAILLGSLGAAGIILPPVDYYLYGVIKPLDFFILLETAIVLGVCALTYEHQPLSIKVPSIGLIRLKPFKKQLAAWLPKPLTAPSRQWHTHA